MHPGKLWPFVLFGTAAFAAAPAAYGILHPAVPEVAVRPPSGRVLGVSTSLKLPPAGVDASAPLRLQLPKLGLDLPVFEGENEKEELDKGVWHRPGSSTPLAGGNVVLLGHRFAGLSNPNVFYHLDAVKAGDELSLSQGMERYAYRVRSVREVQPDAVEIEAPSPVPLLTLYTCTPLLTASRRLVVTAELLP